MEKKQNIKSKTAFMVRDLDPMYIEQLDRKAKALSSKLNRKVSREEYVRMILEGDHAMPMYELQKKLLEDTIDRFTRIMEVQTDTFERYIESNEMMIEIMTGLPIEEIRGGISND